MTTPSNAYWARRAASRMREYDRRSSGALRIVNRAYDDAINELQSGISALLSRFEGRFDLTRDEAMNILRRRISGDEWSRLKRIYDSVPEGTARKFVNAQLNAGSFRYRITRLEAMQDTVRIACAKIADIEHKTTRKMLMDVGQEAWMRTAYDTQTTIGIGWDAGGISERRLSMMLREQWMGKNYSDRVWGNANQLAKNTQRSLLQGVLAGKNQKQIARAMEEEFAVGKYAATRLIRTESAYIANSVELERYKEDDVSEYIFLATHDHKTSDVCIDHDARIYKTADAKIGINFPPLHPWCRSTTGMVFSREWLTTVTKAATDRKGSYARIPMDMSYREWRSWQDAGSPDVNEWLKSRRS